MKFEGRRLERNRSGEDHPNRGVQADIKLRVVEKELELFEPFAALS